MATTNSIADQTGIRSFEEYQQTRTPKTELGKNDFLELLAAQLSYQNPLEPMTDTAFVAQLAQFSSLQQMENMSNALTTSQYYDMVGRYVYAEVKLDTGEQALVHGNVDRVILKDGKAFAQVGDYLIDCSKITQVMDKDILNGNTPLLENANLIGKYIRANSFNDKGEAAGVITGECTRVTIEDNVLIAYLDSGEKVGVGDIIDISNSPFPTGEDSGDPETGGETETETETKA